MIGTRHLFENKPRRNGFDHMALMRAATSVAFELLYDCLPPKRFPDALEVEKEQKNSEYEKRMGGVPYIAEIVDFKIKK